MNILNDEIEKQFKLVKTMVEELKMIFSESDIKITHDHPSNSFNVNFKNSDIELDICSLFFDNKYHVTGYKKTNPDSNIDLISTFEDMYINGDDIKNMLIEINKLSNP
jgi:hypothetical protein